MNFSRGKIQRILFSLFFIMCLSSPRFALSESNPEIRASIRIAVVDLRYVMENSYVWENFMQERQTREQEFHDIMQGYRNRLSILEIEYENLPPGTDRTVKKREEMESLEQEYRQRQEELSDSFNRYLLESLSGIYNDLEGVIASYAEENGIELVLKKQQVNWAEIKMEDLGVLQTADVLFAASDLDISAEITDLLNELYDAEDID